MGKGNGNHPPQKFFHDQSFCQILIMVFMGVSITLSSLSAGMDDGGSFNVPYFFSGFVLGLILFVNLVSRTCVIHAVKKKGLTRKNIVDVLTKTNCGKIIWPWSCRIGMAWCIPGCIITGLGGVNCMIDENADTTTNTVKNNCYYDIEGEHGDMYKGLAIGLVIVHVLSFGCLVFSNCPEQSVLDEIKADPNPPRRNAVAPATQTIAAQVSATNTTVSTSALSAPPANGNVTNSDQRGIEMEALKKQMNERNKELDKRERELSERERQLWDVTFIPRPPSYNEIMTIPD